MPGYQIPAMMCLILFLGCSSPKKSTGIESLSWLQGEWVSQNPGSDMVTRETWKANSGKLEGKGEVIKNGETTFTEILSIEMVEGTLSYVANVAHNTDPVQFKLTKIQNDSWTFENPTHDFPKSIQYIRTEGGFEAVVSGGERKFKLNFKKE